ncbi:MBL fold metallo-hydrolase [Bacillus sp. V2I10]|uniref:MBL fold metallo-hydrolase n=1 Tax=Bacillus sp. V2I10 TaxID=3042276 RepID=UPI00277F765F|nr:MBL fold metallo-hydrolase [Bacillus sp. V2I10]MDQ0859399.1 glyoxylase-like metal-dependent hydrolase (beta-lactamase superfamily II) [Bacillus sp. V2I10]
MNNYHLLEIEFDYNGQKQIVTPILLQDERDIILIDCGYPDFKNLLEEACIQHNVKLDSITKLIVTHHDMDHIGSLAELKRTYPHMEIVAYELEAPYIEGEKKSLRLEQAESTFDSLPDEEKPHAEQFIHFLQSIEPVPVDRTVSNNEQLPWCGGINIVHTPGHLPGHISLYLPASKTLIAGDVVVIEQGKLEIANPKFTLDLDEAVRSVQLLLDYNIEHIICYHGGLFQGDVKQALLQLIHSYRA